MWESVGLLLKYSSSGFTHLLGLSPCKHQPWSVRRTVVSLSGRRAERSPQFWTVVCTGKVCSHEESRSLPVPGWCPAGLAWDWLGAGQAQLAQQRGPGPPVPEPSPGGLHRPPGHRCTPVRAVRWPARGRAGLQLCSRTPPHALGHAAGFAASTGCSGAGCAPQGRERVLPVSWDLPDASQWQLLGLSPSMWHQQKRPHKTKALPPAESVGVTRASWLQAIGALLWQDCLWPLLIFADF